MEAALSLAVAVRSHRRCAPPPAAHGAAARRSSAAAPRFGRPHRRLRALPPELSEILSPKLVPGSPADTGDVSSLIPISALMLFFYFVSNWVVPELLMKGLRQQPETEEDEAANAAPTASMSLQGDAVDGQQTDIAADASPGKIRLKVKTKKKKKKSKAATKV